MINKSTSSSERDAVDEERTSNDRAHCAFVITRTIRYRSTWLGIVTYDLELPPRMIHCLSPFIRPVRSCRACSWPRLRGKIPAESELLAEYLANLFCTHVHTHTHTRFENTARETYQSDTWVHYSLFVPCSFLGSFFEFLFFNRFD